MGRPSSTHPIDFHGACVSYCEETCNPSLDFRSFLNFARSFLAFEVTCSVAASAFSFNVTLSQTFNSGVKLGDRKRTCV
jgi:hypothetical protein